jgi:hypothetical protein
MSRPSRRVQLFMLACAVSFVAPTLLHKQFSLYPLMKAGDVFDILTPVVFNPLTGSCTG